MKALITLLLSGIVVATLITCALLPSASPERFINIHAQTVCEKAILETFPGARELSECRIARSNNFFRVTMRVDGLNAFGGPVRQDVAVEMLHTGNNRWTILRIER